MMSNVCRFQQCVADALAAYNTLIQNEAGGYLHCATLSLLYDLLPYYN